MKKQRVKNRSFSLRNKLIFSFLIVLLIPSITISLTSYFSSKSNIEIQMHEKTAENINLFNQTIDQFISGQMENINFLSSTIITENIANDNDIQTRKLLDTIQKSKVDVEQTYVGTETGEFMNSPTSFKNPPDYDPRERPWYKTAMSNRGNTIITDPYVSQSSKQVVVTLAKVTEDGKGVVAVNLKLGSLSEMLSQVKIGDAGYLFLLDKTGHIISHPTDEAGSEVTESLIEKILKSDSGNLQYVDSAKNEKTISFTTSELTGWKTGGVMYEQEINNAVQPILNTTIIILIGSLILGAALILFIILSIIKPIDKLSSATDMISQGDLSMEINLKNQDELSQLAKAFNHMRKNLSEIILQVRDKSGSLAASSEQLNASTEQNTAATEQISTSIQSVASGMEKQATLIDQSSKMAAEMAEAIQYITENSQEVSQTASNASSAITAGNIAIETSVGQMEYIKKTVNELSGSIEGLGTQSQEISKIIDVIKNIAEQTNLLALNAAIEAARAGEHGKGFAVVADEVRKLAEQSAQSTEQIRQMIGSIQNETANAVKSMEAGTAEVEKGIEVVSHAGESFNAITGFVGTIAEQIEQISTKIQEISAGTEQFVYTFDEVASVADTTLGGAQNVSASTQEQLASMEEIRSSASSLSIIAEELQDLVQKFKL